VKLTNKQAESLLAVLKGRFEKNMSRHQGIDWPAVVSRLESKPDKLRALHAMEDTGGEPDVIGWNRNTGEIIFCDCSSESPAGRRSLCYDRKALESRKENKPEGSVIDMAASLGVELLTEKEYLGLQELGCFDARTSSWVKTPPEIRRLGGALFCDRRYNTVFVYHNGAQSYYAARGFRGIVRI